MNFLKLNKTITGCFVALITLSIFLTSCEKTNDLAEIKNTEEGYKSTTNNKTPISINENDEVLAPLMHKRFSGDLTEEEVDAKWEAEVEKYLKQVKLDETTSGKMGVSTELIFSLRTKTGSQTNNGTDGDAYGRLNFASNRGNLTTAWFELDNFGDDREEGDWDAYLIESPITGSSIRWARARWAQLALKGTDGWFPTDFDIHIHTSYQTVPATGSSHIYDSPNDWLDSSSSGAWDYYKTGNIGYGTLNF